MFYGHSGRGLRNLINNVFKSAARFWTHKKQRSGCDTPIGPRIHAQNLSKCICRDSNPGRSDGNAAWYPYTTDAYIFLSFVGYWNIYWTKKFSGAVFCFLGPRKQRNASAFCGWPLGACVCLLDRFRSVSLEFGSPLSAPYHFRKPPRQLDVHQRPDMEGSVHCSLFSGYRWLQQGTASWQGERW